MQDQVYLTVFCLAYNHGQYIKQCLDGFVLQQTNFKFEVVVHDDASTDDTARIIQSYADKYPGLIVPILEEENQFSKRNNSISRIVIPYFRGKYIAFCEGDDYWIDQNKLQRQVDFLDSHTDYTMCFHNAFVLKSKGDRIGARLFNNHEEDFDLTPREALFDWVVPTASIVVRKDSIIPTQKWTVDNPLSDISIIFQSLVAGKVRYIHFVGSVYRQVLRGGSSASANYLNRNYFENNKRIVSGLVTLPHEIADVAQERLSFLEKEQKFVRLFNKSKVLCFVFMPRYFVKRVIHRIIKIKAICWLY